MTMFGVHPGETWLDDISVELLENDPYPVFARLRQEAPVAWIPALQAWMVSTWKDCWEIASDFENYGGTTDPNTEHVFGQPCILSVDGDVHAELRSMVDPNLRPRAVRRYIEDLVRPIAQRQLAAIKDRGSAELMTEYFEPISVRSLGDLLGFAEVDADTLRRWFHDLSTGFANKALNPEGFEPSDRATEQIKAFVDPKLAQLAREPDDSALSHWLHDGMPEGQTRPPEFIYPTLLVILLGGMQEPGHGAGSVLAGLMTRPDQMQRVVEDRNLVPKAVNEGLRWVAPIWTTLGRRPFQEVRRGDVTLPAGAHVLLSYGSANWDGNEFDNPEVFDMDRAQHPHMAFGTGKHACAGSSFAPNVVRIALEELLGGLPSLQLQEDPTFWGFIFRGPRELQVKWTTQV
jgi:aromatic O-demethylase, cytochrome P450 subunit